MTRQRLPIRIKKVFIGDRVYREVRRMLVDREIAPGARIDKAELCAQLGVSPTPVNEAVKRLLGEELIDSRGKDGIYSRRYSPQDLVDFHEARAAIEGMSIRLCIEKLSAASRDELTHYYDHFSFPMGPAETLRYQDADRGFHEKLILESGNGVFIKFVQTFNLMASSYQMGLLRPPQETLPEHLRIIRAIKARKGEEAQRLIVEHHMRSRNALKEKIRKGLLPEL
jgi:DNA-binding GntR family transcriptional regulator